MKRMKFDKAVIDSFYTEEAAVVVFEDLSYAMLIGTYDGNEWLYSDRPKVETDQDKYKVWNSDIGETLIEHGLIDADECERGAKRHEAECARQKEREQRKRLQKFERDKKEWLALSEEEKMQRWLMERDAHLQRARKHNDNNKAMMSKGIMATMMYMPEEFECFTKWEYDNNKRYVANESKKTHSKPKLMIGI